MRISAPSAAAIGDRVVPFALLLIGFYAAATLVMALTSSNGLDAGGRPLGSDFSNVWAAGRLALAGTPEAAYDLAAHYAVQVERFGAGVPFYGWHYPPMFLGVAALLATLPYLGALAVWQAATLPLYLLALTRILEGRRREVLLAGLAFPAVFVNLAHGHNGFLTAGLFGLGLVVLDRRPILAGVLLGLLAYKPQFGVLLPLALIATGRWRTTAAAAASVLATAGLSLAAFGPETWAAFQASATFTRSVVLEAGSTGWEKIVSVFSAARALGASVAMAYAAQGLATAAVAILTVRLWRSAAPFGAKAAALMAGALLATPYALDYDMMLLGPAIAFLVRDGLALGWRRCEPALLAAAFAAPLVARGVAGVTFVPLGLLAIALVFALATARGPGLPSRLKVAADATG